MIAEALPYLALLPIVSALIQLIKMAFPSVPSRFLPLISMAAGAGVTVTYAISFGTFDKFIVFIALVVGLAASGMYDVVTKTLREEQSFTLR